MDLSILLFLIENRGFRTLAATLVVSLLLCCRPISSTLVAEVLRMLSTANSVFQAFLSPSISPNTAFFLLRIWKSVFLRMLTHLEFGIPDQPMDPPNVFLTQ